MKRTTYLLITALAAGLLMTGCNSLEDAEAVLDSVPDISGMVDTSAVNETLNNLSTGVLSQESIDNMGEMLNQAQQVISEASDMLNTSEFNEGVSKVLAQTGDITEYIDLGHCYVACEDGKAVLMYFDKGNITMESVANMGNKLSITNIDGQWDTVYNKIKMLDATGKTYDDYSWSVETEGDLTVVKVSNGDRELTFYELSESSLKDGEQLAGKYLKNRRTLEQVEDIKTALESYEGVSIVNAFLSSGLDPDFATRAQAAAELGIEKYKGSAEQNLELIKLLGGAVK